MTLNNKVISFLASIFCLLTFSSAYSADLNKLQLLQTYATVALERGCTGAVVEQNKQYYVTTAAHCVRSKTNKYFVTTGKSLVDTFHLILVRVDYARDVALYKIMDKQFLMPITYKLADDFDVQAGEDVWIIGNPCWMGECLDPASVTRGVLSFVFRKSFVFKNTVVHQFNIPMRGGYSGAPLLNDELEIIGIVSHGKPGMVITPMGPAQVDEASVINFAMPVVYMHNLFRSL